MTTLGFAILLATQTQKPIIGHNPYPFPIYGAAQDWDFQDADLRKVLKAIFTKANLSYSITPEVQGTVTIHLTKAAFGTALSRVLDQVGATYHHEAGVFIIVKRAKLDPDQIIPLYKAEELDVHEALKRLPIDYVCMDKIQGPITMELHGLKLEQVLNYMLLQVGATFTIQNDLVVIRKRTSKEQISLSKTLPNVGFHDTDIRQALLELFGMVGSDYWIAPEISGKVTMSLENQPFEQVLQYALNSVNASYRIEENTFLIVRNHPRDGDILPTTLAHCDPVGSTSTTTLNAKPMLSPQRTVGGTYDLLLEAARTAGFSHSALYTYGKSGFAVVLPFEAIDAQGRPTKDRFSFEPSFLDELDFTKLGSYFAHSRGNRNQDYRMIVLTADDGTASREKDGGHYGDDMPLPMRRQKWTGTPKISAFVYEFRRQNNKPVATLVKTSPISAKQHLALAGLWTKR